jgi:hypothetical protein
MKLIKLNYWTIIGDKLFGSIYNHPSIIDGSFIISSKIKIREGDLVYTQKAVYQLLKPF